MLSYGLTLGTLAILGVVAWAYEHSRFSSKEVALLVALAALAALGRVPFAAIPSVQPTTVVVLLSGLVFGPLAGMIVGLSAAWGSNCFLGQGPWTLWQMLAWGLVGWTAGWIGYLLPGGGRGTLMVLGIGWGYLFGWIMNAWYWCTFIYPLTLKSWLLVNAASFWFDTLHALGNVVFVWILGGKLLSILRRFRRRLAIHAR